MNSGLIAAIGALGEDATDSVELRSQKRVLVMVSLAVGVLAIAWGAVYLAFGEPLAASIPWTYTIGVAVSLAFFAATGRYPVFRLAQLVLILLLPFLLQLALGGFVNASAVIIWSLLAPLGALAMWGRRQAILWFVAYAALVVLAQLLRPSLQVDNNLPVPVVAAYFVANIVAATGVAFFALHYFVGEKDVALDLLDVEKAKSEGLLLNILPAEIAARLKEGDEAIATRFEAVSVLFVDVVDFTPLAEQLDPNEVVAVLNDVFTHFDLLVAKRGLEKIRTMGDAYMVASGIPVPRGDHAQALAHTALEMLEYRPERAVAKSLRFRAGISSGPAVAGVIGRSKFQYDVWGDTVNTASRMEAQGVPDKIQITSVTKDLLGPGFVYEPRGVIEVKGKGPMETWFLVGARD